MFRSRPWAFVGGLAIVTCAACTQRPAGPSPEAQPPVVVLQIPVGQKVDGLKGAAWPTDPNTGKLDERFSIKGNLMVVLSPGAGQSSGIHVMRCSCKQEGGIIQEAICHYSQDYTYDQVLQEIKQSAKALGL